MDLKYSSERVLLSKLKMGVKQLSGVQIGMISSRFQDNNSSRKKLFITVPDRGFIPLLSTFCAL